MDEGCPATTAAAVSRVAGRGAPQAAADVVSMAPDMSANSVVTWRGAGTAKTRFHEDNNTGWASC